jgi:hypothetical protein
VAELKTKKQNTGVKQFIDDIQDPEVRQDCMVLHELMSRITGDEGDMWGTSIVGYGTYHYRYATGREADWLRMGFSPRKQNLTMYFMSGFTEMQDLLDKIGPHSLGKGCLYVKRLSDIDLKVLEALIKRSSASKNFGEV